MSYRANSVEGRFLRGDLEAVGQVFRWISRVLTLPRFWALREEWADLHQEVLGRVTESLRQDRFDDTREFRTYVQGVARLTAIVLAQRRRAERSESLTAAVPDGRADPELRSSARLMARRVLDLATDECRRLIRSYFFAGNTYREIAEAGGMPVGTVKSRLFRCLDAAHRSIRSVSGPATGPKEAGKGRAV